MIVTREKEEVETMVSTSLGFEVIEYTAKEHKLYSDFDNGAVRESTTCC